MKPFESFTSPEDKAEYHLVAFFVQLVVIAASFLLTCKLFFVVDNGRYGLESKAGFWASVKANLRAQEGEEKVFKKLPSLETDENKAVTDQFIDLKKGGMWLTERQEVMFYAYLLGAYFANLILVFSGAGPLYRRARGLIALLTREMLPLFLLIIPFGIWGALLCIILFVTGVATMLLAPFNLLLHLGLGILQTVLIVKKRK